MDIRGVKAICGEYGEFCNRGVRNPLGFPSVNPIHTQMQTAKAVGKPGKIFKRIGNIIVEWSVKNHSQKPAYRDRSLEYDVMPVQFLPLQGFLDGIKKTHPYMYDVFWHHYCVYFINGKRANIKTKIKNLDISKRQYYYRLQLLHDEILAIYTDICELEAVIFK